MNARPTTGTAADPAALGPNPTPAAQPPPTLDPATMEAAFADGTAVPLTSHVTSLVTYRGVWWLDDDDAWLQITDQAFSAHLEAIHERQ